MSRAGATIELCWSLPAAADARGVAGYHVQHAALSERLAGGADGSTSAPDWLDLPFVERGEHGGAPAPTRADVTSALADGGAGRRAFRCRAFGTADANGLPGNGGSFFLVEQLEKKSSSLFFLCQGGSTETGAMWQSTRPRTSSKA